MATGGYTEQAEIRVHTCKFLFPVTLSVLHEDEAPAVGQKAQLSGSERRTAHRMTPSLQVSVAGYPAIVRFVGSAHFAPGEWIGVELEPGQPATRCEREHAWHVPLLVQLQLPFACHA